MSLGEFAHFIEIAPRSQNPKVISRILREKGAPETRYCISASSKLDAKRLPLPQALDEIVERAMGTFLSRLPDILGYLEDQDQRCLLERKQIR